MEYLHIFAYICPKWPKCRERFQQNGAYRYYNGCSSPRSSTTGGGGFRSLSGAWSVMGETASAKDLPGNMRIFPLRIFFQRQWRFFMGMWWLVLRIGILTGWAAVIWPDDAVKWDITHAHLNCPFDMVGKLPRATGFWVYRIIGTLFFCGLGTSTTEEAGLVLQPCFGVFLGPRDRWTAIWLNGPSDQRWRDTLW